MTSVRRIFLVTFWAVLVFSVGFVAFRSSLSSHASGIVTNPDTVFSLVAAPKPGYLSPTLEPTFSTTITRIANDPSQSMSWAGPPSGSGTWGSDARHHYQKDQPWNSDGTIIALQNSGSPSAIYLDGETYQPVYGKCSTYNPGDDRWHPSPSHSYERISANNGTTLQWYDIVNCSQTRVWTLPFAVDYFGSGEGNPSSDGRFVALADATRMFVVDMDPQDPLVSYADGNRRIGPAVTLSGCGLADCSIDWVSISPSGKYVVVSYSGDHPRVYDVNSTDLSLTPRSMPPTSPECSGHDPLAGYIFDLGHAEMTINPADNKDVIVGQRRSWCPSEVDGVLQGSVQMVRLEDNLLTSLTNPSNEASSHHISARSYNRPGWVYVGYYPSSNKRFSDEIVAIQIDGPTVNGNKPVERWAQKHSDTPGCYRCETHAVPSPDGMRVLWASNWALNCTGASCPTSCPVTDPGTNCSVQALVVDSRPLRAGGNQAPNGTIDTPTGPTTITVGQSVSFTGTGSDTDGNTPLSYLWNFNGGAANSTLEDPGSIQFDTAGTYNATFTVTDSLGLPDSSPDTRVITVNVAPTTLTFEPTADTHIRFDYPDNNYGTATTMNLKGGIAPNIQDILLKFVVTGVGMSSVSNATLNLWSELDGSTATGPSGGTFWPVPDNSWSESTVTWNTAPASTTPAIGTIQGPIAASTQYSVDLTSYITGDGTYSIRVGNTNTTNGINYVSKENTTYPTRHPQLVLTLVPAGDTTPPVRSNGQPSGVLLAGTGTTSLTLITDESATCRYSLTSGPYESMALFDFTSDPDVFTHSQTITVADGASYTYYVRCMNAALIPNPDDYQIFFSVAANQAPNGTIDTPTGPTTITAGGSVSFAGTGLDPDDHTPLTYAWNFNGGAANSTLEDPGSITFNTAGTYNITFTVTDSLGLPDSSPDTRVITVNPVSDTTPPTVSITAPAAGTVLGSVLVEATASDASGIQQVEFFRDSTSLGVDTTSPYSVSWNTALVSDGPYALTAVATDASSNANIQTSAAVNVTVNNGGGGPPIPSVSTQTPSLNDGGDSGLYEVGTNLSIFSDSMVFCPLGMMWVPLSGGFCIDRYEAYNSGSPGSSPDQPPWNTISFANAESACLAIGKRLPTREEWLVAAFGTPEPAASPTACASSGSLVNTGLRPGCKSTFGVYDMIGNVAEWTSETSGSKARGGSYEDGLAASRTSEISSAAAEVTIGFRCVR
ncbi:MAG: Metallophosphoesterase [Parcubacteria group bacterium GW2011_GWA1_50_14]|nr:MAG: Metallophosphoesterase [Parcubacteria group bacterium GW2011_GWA1_50_14]